MRGKFIVFEGLDRSGKSSQAKLISEELAKEGGRCELIGFPNRQSETGRMINKYLTSQMEASNQAIHLLFSANRWEAMAEIEKKLSEGVNICCDRYFYSGVAYSAAKGLDLEWCKQADRGLLEPDIVFYLRSEPELLAKRSGYGEQRFERLQFQRKVYESFETLFQHNPRVQVVEVNAKSIAEIREEVMKTVNTRLLGREEA